MISFPHPEGGQFRETWRDRPAGGGRGAGTAIYYLLASGERSHWHRVDAEEVFLSGAIRSKTVIKTRRLEMKLASSNDSQLEVHFAASVLETSDVSVQLESPGAPPSRADSGWTILDAATAAGTSAPSPSKSSRRSEGLGRRR